MLCREVFPDAPWRQLSLGLNTLDFLLDSACSPSVPFPLKGQSCACRKSFLVVQGASTPFPMQKRFKYVIQGPPTFSSSLPFRFFGSETLAGSLNMLTSYNRSFRTGDIDLFYSCMLPVPSFEPRALPCRQTKVGRQERCLSCLGRTQRSEQQSTSAELSRLDLLITIHNRN